MTTATRFGSRDEAFAQRMISFAQYWTSRVKMGEIPEDVPGLAIDADAAEVTMGMLNVSAVSRHAMKMVERRGRE
jgi:hypothetical protein